jgi:dTMP kinase
MVLCDRYIDSSIAYQGYGRELGAEMVRQINDLAAGGLKPDLTLLLDVAAEVGLKRRRGQTAADRLEQEDLVFYRRVRQGYRELAVQEPERIQLIDASGPPQAVWLQIKKVVDTLTESF